MALHANEKIGRNDPCPCGSGKKLQGFTILYEQTLVPGGGGFEFWLRK